MIRLKILVNVLVFFVGLTFVFAIGIASAQPECLPPGPPVVDNEPDCETCDVVTQTVAPTKDDYYGGVHVVKSKDYAFTDVSYLAPRGHALFRLSNDAFLGLFGGVELGAKLCDKPVRVYGFVEAGVTIGSGEEIEVPLGVGIGYKNVCLEVGYFRDWRDREEDFTVVSVGWRF